MLGGGQELQPLRIDLTRAPLTDSLGDPAHADLQQLAVARAEVPLI